MKKLIGMVLVIGLLIGGTINSNAAVIQGTKGRTYITLDKTELRENESVLKYVGVKNNYKISASKNCWTLKFNSKKNAKDTKKQIKKIAEEIHGCKIEDQFKEYRTYKVVVKGKDIKGKTHTYTINGHKVK